MSLWFERICIGIALFVLGASVSALVGIAIAACLHWIR
jgi:hypothetical protein